MAKSRGFSIYLLKTGFDDKAALKEGHILQPSPQSAGLPVGSAIYLLDEKAQPPWWKDYFNLSRDLKQALKGAIVFLPVSGRHFALCFGHVSHHLLATSYEHDFGLIVTLNSIDPKKLKSTDTLDPGVSKRRRTQLPKASDLTVLDFDRDSTILRSLTGTSRDEFAGLFKHATGSANLRISSSVPAHELAVLCQKVLDLYASPDYKKTFPDIQNIAAVREPGLIDQLNAALLTAVRQRPPELQMCIPALVDYSDSFYVSFSGAGRGNRYDDVDIDNYYAYLSDRGVDLTSLSVSDLKRHELILQNDDQQTRIGHPIIKCLVFETVLKGQKGAMFHLSDGLWYKVEKNYLTQLYNRLDSCFGTCSLPKCAQQREDEYNEHAAASDASLYCLDKKSVAPAGQTALEPCDLIQLHGDKARLYHIKISTRSSQLSHLFNQGMNAAHLFKGSEEAVDKLEKLLRKAPVSVNGPAIVQAVRDKKVEIIYGIITRKDAAGKTDNLPLFSRITLVRVVDYLRLLDVALTVAFIADETTSKPRKQSNKKKRT